MRLSSLLEFGGQIRDGQRCDFPLRVDTLQIALAGIITNNYHIYEETVSEFSLFTSSEFRIANRTGSNCSRM